MSSRRIIQTARESTTPRPQYRARNRSPTPITSPALSDISSISSSPTPPVASTSRTQSVPFLREIQMPPRLLPPNLPASSMGSPSQYWPQFNYNPPRIELGHAPFMPPPPLLRPPGVAPPLMRPPAPRQNINQPEQPEQRPRIRFQIGAVEEARLRARGERIIRRRNYRIRMQRRLNRRHGLRVGLSRMNRYTVHLINMLEDFISEINHLL